MRWHIVFKEEQMKLLSQTCYASIASSSPTVAAVVKKMKKNNVDKHELFFRVVENFFYGYLSFPVSVG
jgi:predicted metal-dependent TIM-barrel fold hydrolase